MRKFRLCFMTFLLVMILGNANDVFASSYQDLFDDAASFIPNIYIAKEKDGVRRYRQMTTIERKSDGALAYCIEADEYGNKDTILNGVDYDHAIFASLTDEEWRRISLIAYYGYGYGDHTDLKWYAISQIMIWQTIPYGYDIYFTEGLNGKKTDRYAKEMEEIENLIQMHDVKPSFDGKHYKLALGEVLELTDTNSVLSLYEIDSGNLFGQKNGANAITFLANTIGTETIFLTKKDKNLKTPMIVYVDSVLQDVIVRGSYEDVIASVSFEVVGGHVNIEKKDGESGIGLSKAIFGIYTNDEKKLGAITTNELGIGQSMVLPGLGKYYLQEEVAPVGYKLDNKKYYFEITKDNLYPTVSIKNEIIKGQVILTKVLAMNQTGFMEAEVDAEFGIYNEDGILYKKVVTDQNGKAEITLPYGIWEFRQLSSKYNYEKVEDFKVEIKNEETKEFVISDALISGRLKIVKTDSVTGNVVHLAGISFKIKNQDTKEYVCQKVTYPSVSVLCEFQTSEQGILITPYPLPIGKYELEEVDQKMDGYLWNSKKLEFEIGNDTIFTKSESGEKVLEIKFQNTPVMGEVEIFKYGEKMVSENGSFSYQEIKLDGVCFSLYANEDIYSSDGILKYKTASLIKDVCTKDGYTKISDLHLGSYYLVETSTLDGFVLDSDKHYFTLSYKDQYTSIVTSSLTLKNNLKKGTLEFTKEDFLTGQVLPDTLIEVYNSLDEVIFRGTTNEYGKIIIQNLGYGKYYVLEKEAPDGYILNDQKLYFEILEDGEVVKTFMQNEKKEDVPKTNIIISSSNLLTRILPFLFLGVIKFLILPLKRNI